MRHFAAAFLALCFCLLAACAGMEGGRPAVPVQPETPPPETPPVEKWLGNLKKYTPRDNRNIPPLTIRNCFRSSLVGSLRPFGPAPCFGDSPSISYPSKILYLSYRFYQIRRDITRSIF